jgi:Ssp1 endopeptidase immunity protein Rap1a
MRLVLLICAASLLLPSTASANNDILDFSHGSGLFSALSHCAKSSSSFGKEHPSQDDLYDCFEALGYIRGVVDALPFSRPEGVTYGQDFEIVYAYLKNHVNQRQRLSVELIRDALLEAFPPPKA